MEKLSKKIIIGISSTVVITLVMFVGIGIEKEGLSALTTYSGDETQANKEQTYLPIKIILGKTEPASNALFDIIVTIPEDSREVIPGENLLLSIELINFGEPGKTNVSINYIITNSKGDIVLIKHERRVVETQLEFLNEIDLPDLKYGNYKLFVELLYSNTSAIATDEFRFIT